MQPFGPQTNATLSTFAIGDSGANGMADAVPAVSAAPPSAIKPTSANLSFMVSSGGI
jgi:hypothetical protein